MVTLTGLAVGAIASVTTVPEYVGAVVAVVIAVAGFLAFLWLRRRG